MASLTIALSQVIAMCKPSLVICAFVQLQTSSYLLAYSLASRQSNPWTTRTTTQNNLQQIHVSNSVYSRKWKHSWSKRYKHMNKLSKSHTIPTILLHTIWTQRSCMNDRVRPMVHGYQFMFVQLSCTKGPMCNIWLPRAMQSVNGMHVPTWLRHLVPLQTDRKSWSFTSGCSINRFTITWMALKRATRPLVHWKASVIKGLST